MKYGEFWTGRQHTRHTIAKMQRSSYNGKRRRLDSNGYVYLYAPNHQRAKCGRVPEQILVMEHHLGRPIRPGEVVHHVNKIKTDNNIDNLELKTTTQHMRDHALERGLGTLIQGTPRRSVKCIELDIIYPSIRAAAKKIGVTHQSLIYALKNQTKSCGYTWRYADQSSGGI